MRIEAVVAEAAAAESNGVAWPVVIIGGVVIVAGLIAVRSEFANFRSRRTARRQ